MYGTNKMIYFTMLQYIVQQLNQANQSSSAGEAELPGDGREEGSCDLQALTQYKLI